MEQAKSSRIAVIEASAISRPQGRRLHSWPNKPKPCNPACKRIVKSRKGYTALIPPHERIGAHARCLQDSMPSRGEASQLTTVLGGRHHKAASQASIVSQSCVSEQAACLRQAEPLLTSCGVLACRRMMLAMLAGAGIQTAPKQVHISPSTEVATPKQTPNSWVDVGGAHRVVSAAGLPKGAVVGCCNNVFQSL